MGWRTIAGIVVALMAGSSAFAQVPSAVLEHRPLPLEEGRSYETARAAVPVLEETVLAGRVRLAFANRPDHRAAGPSDDPDYADYGQYTGDPLTCTFVINPCDISDATYAQEQGEYGRMLDLPSNCTEEEYNEHAWPMLYLQSYDWDDWDERLYPTYDLTVPAFNGRIVI